MHGCQPFFSPLRSVKIMIAVSICALLISKNASAGETIFVDPDATTFQFEFNDAGQNKFCNLTMAAVKPPQSVSLVAVGGRHGPGDKHVLWI